MAITTIDGISEILLNNPVYDKSLEDYLRYNQNYIMLENKIIIIPFCICCTEHSKESVIGCNNTISRVFIKRSTGGETRPIVQMDISNGCSDLVCTIEAYHPNGFDFSYYYKNKKREKKAIESYSDDIEKGLSVLRSIRDHGENDRDRIQAIQLIWLISGSKE